MDELTAGYTQQLSIDFSTKYTILLLENKKPMKLFGMALPDRTAEDSLENTLNCVPKVQGVGAESLRQTDGDGNLF